MDYKEITALIKLIDKTNLSEFKLKNQDVEISIKTDKYQKGKTEVQHITTSPAREVVMAAPAAATPAPAQEAAPAPQPASAPKADSPGPDESHLLEVRSPIVGTFYRAPAPDKPPFVGVGDVISEGDTVCIVEAMKLFNEIESEISGKIVKVVAEDASPVEYDQVLFLVDPKG